MKLLGFGLLLVVLAGMVSVVDATNYIHTFSSGTQVGGPFEYGAYITDEVSSNSPETSIMFTWKDPTGEDVFTDICTRESKETNYSSSLSSANYAGTWTVTVYEKSNVDTESFVVKDVPEFIFGSFISVFAAGGLFLVMRRKVQ